MTKHLGLLSILLTSMVSTSAWAKRIETVGAFPGPIAVFSYYEDNDLDKILDTISASAPLADIPVFVGQYGVDCEQAQRIKKKLPSNGYYAPILAPKRKDFPFPKDLVSLKPGEPERWGLEMGRRLRDKIRHKTCVDSWQFDEISPTASLTTEQGAAWRAFTASAIHGLAYGRPKLKDKLMPGLVFIAHPAAFAKLPDSEDHVKRLIWELDNVALRIMGEEYVFFRGDAGAEADRWYETQWTLKKAGGPRSRLAARYIPAMTPGYNLYNAKCEWSHLNGNVDVKPDDWVNAWRRKFVLERASSGPAGFGQYAFGGDNSLSKRIQAAVESIALGIQALPKNARTDKPFKAIPREPHHFDHRPNPDNVPQRCSRGGVNRAL